LARDNKNHPHPTNNQIYSVPANPFSPSPITTLLPRLLSFSILKKRKKGKGKNRKQGEEKSCKSRKQSASNITNLKEYDDVVNKVSDKATVADIYVSTLQSYTVLSCFKKKIKLWCWSAVLLDLTTGGQY